MTDAAQRSPRSDLGSFAHGQFRVDYEHRHDPNELREKRIAKARAEMEAAALDALLLWKDENVRYLTGLRAQLIAGKSALLNGCVLVGDEPPILLASGGEIQRVSVVMPWIEEFHAVPIMEERGLVRAAVEQTIEPLLRRHGVSRLGLDEAAYCQVEALRELPEVELADGDAVLQRARLVKLAEEVALIEEACAIGEAVLDAAVRAIRPGARETDVAGEAMRELYRLGGELSHVTTPFVASGEHMAPPNRIASDKIIRNGDVVFIDIGAMWSGYFGDLGRTVVCGSPSRRQQEVFTAVYDALEAARAAMSAGSTNDDVARAARGAAAERGFPAETFISLFIGHGVGIGANEPPYIGEELPGAETVVLEEGMTFAVEPLIWIPGVRGGAGVRLEDTILVTNDGGRPLSRAPFDERLLLD